MEVVASAPQEIGRDEIVLESQVGSGSFAVVHRGRIRGTVVAIKQAKTSVFHGLTQEQIKSFQNEVKILSKLAHPNLVLFMGVSVSDKELLIVTEFLDEGNLEDKLFGPSELPLFRRMRWAKQACSGLAWLHGSGVLHLDYKPANMLLSSDVVKLCDFGLSKLLPVGKHYKSSKIVGTPVYCAPEVLSGDVFDHLADVFSFGVSLFVIATRLPPRLASDKFYETRESFVEAVCKNGERPRVSNGQALLTPSLRKLVDWCWEQKPSRRPSASLCVEKLERLMIESATRGDEAGALVWAKASSSVGSDVKESVAFADFCMSLFEVTATKRKDLSSRSAILLRAVLNSMGGDDNVVRLTDFGRLCGLLGPIDKTFLKRLKALTKQPWFFGGVSATEVEKLLLAQGNKTFAVRFSSSTGTANFTLSYVAGNKIWHSRIMHEEGRNTFELDGTNQVFDSLEALVNFGKARNDLLATPAAGGPFVALWQRKKNSVGGYKEFTSQQK